ncbi:MAG TPA: FG-GAP repeat protein, partial [Candidatus Sumerlaeota bacterium]|nr:FG-GAP repeat protein [Candidatus Sumerlaeota bacterium]
GEWIVPADSGSAFVYRHLDDSWVLEAELNSGLEAQQNEFLGYSVAVSGRHVAAGLPDWSANGVRVGAVRVFWLSDDGWTAETMLRHQGTESWNLGCSLALWENTMVAGARGGLGDAFVYVLNEDGWVQRDRLSAPEGDTNTGFGHAVAMWEEWIAVSAIWGVNDGNPSGAVHLYRQVGEEWIHVERLSSPELDKAGAFGDQLAMAGGRLLISDPAADAPEQDSGVAWLYDLNAKNAATAWSRYP